MAISRCKLRTVRPCFQRAIAKVKARSAENGLNYFLFDVYTKRLLIPLLYNFGVTRQASLQNNRFTRENFLSVRIHDRSM